MTGRTRLLRCYPPTWLARYGDDLAAYLDDAYPDRVPVRASAGLVAGGLRERARVVGAAPAPERLRSGVLMVLISWAAFAVAGLSFAKISEHFDASLPGRAGAVPDVAFAVLQAGAALGSLAALAGGLLGVPALVRFLSRGGWPVLRQHVARAALSTALTAAVTMGISAWGRQLTATQRNGGNGAYAATFLVWAGLVAVTVGLWAVAAVVAGRRLSLSRPVLLAEGALAVTVTAGMVVVVGSAGVWWVAMASSAPAFFGAGRSWSAAVATPQLDGTLVLMVAALCWAATGVVRIIRAGAVVSAEARRGA